MFAALLGSRLPHSSAADQTLLALNRLLTAQALLLALGSITASLPIISATFVTVISCWLAAVRS